MTSRLLALTIDALEPEALAEFWDSLLGDDPGLELRFQATDRVKTGRNQMHFDLTSSSLEDQQAIVERALAQGARHLDVGQTGDEGHIVLADPEGNEFCVVEPGNNFLADTARIGALSCDGIQEVGYFWSAALGWPLVWDQDGETAIQAPDGGPKISWGGPPVAPKTGPNRLRLELVADEPSEVGRLLSLGAIRLDAHLFADPGGNELSLATR